MDIQHIAVSEAGKGTVTAGLDDAAPLPLRHGAPGPRAAQGVVEVDETFLSISNRDAPIPEDHSAAQVLPFVRENIEPAAEVRTDGSAAYRELKDLGYAHQRSVVLGPDVPAHVSMAGVHRAAALIKRWIP